MWNRSNTSPNTHRSNSAQLRYSASLGDLGRHRPKFGHLSPTRLVSAPCGPSRGRSSRWPFLRSPPCGSPLDDDHPWGLAPHKRRQGKATRVGPVVVAKQGVLAGGRDKIFAWNTGTLAASYKRNLKPEMLAKFSPSPPFRLHRPSGQRPPRQNAKHYPFLNKTRILNKLEQTRISDFPNTCCLARHCIMFTP